MTDMPDQTSASETARALLDRHGLPEDVVDGALALHAQELAALQRLRMDELDLTGQKARLVGRIVDLIDPTHTAPAAVPVPPPADRAALRARIAAALYRHEWPGKQVWPQALAMDRETFEAMADAVLAVLPEQTDRAALLRQEADQIRAHCPDHLDSDSAPGAWMVCHCDVADDMLRRVAAEEQPAKPARCPHGCDTSICPCLACEAAEEQPAETPMFGTPDCTCIPFTRQGGKPRYCGPTDTVDMISGWEIGRDCPHHKPAVGEQPETQETP